MKNRVFWIKSVIIFMILVLLDQITKYLAYIKLRNHQAFPIIKDVFELQYLENQSAAFGKDPISLLNNVFHWFDNNPDGLLRAKMIFFSILTVIVLVLITLLLNRIPDTKRLMPLKFTLVVFSSGAFGNLIDRVLNNFVVDFFYFKLINFPIFNVADIYVTCAAFMLIILALYYKEDDLNMIFPSKKEKKDN